MNDDGFNFITFEQTATKSMYFRLRATNLPRNTENETDENGNPLSDELVGSNNKN